MTHKTIETLVSELETAILTYAGENGPDPDYKRFARDEWYAARQRLLAAIRELS